MTLQALLTGFKFVYASKIILGIITLDMFAVFLVARRHCCRFMPRRFCLSTRRAGFLQAALPVGSVLCVFI